MAVTVTPLYDPPETVDYDPMTGEVVVVRQYRIDGSYPANSLGIETSSLGLVADVNQIPGTIDVSVYKSAFVTFPPWGLDTVACYIATMHSETMIAPELESEAITRMSVTYRGYTEGVISHDLDIGTESTLQLIDLDYAHVDAEGRPSGIGAEGEGVNKIEPNGEWHIVEIFRDTGNPSWYDKWNKIAILDGSTNEAAWAPTASGSGGIGLWPQSLWLYHGATFEPLPGPYYRLTHTFEPSLHSLELGDSWVHFHKYRWRYERKTQESVDVGGGETDERVAKKYGPENISQIYPIAGKIDLVGGRDLSLHRFADLGL